MNLQEWLDLPEADPDTRACPHCGGLHFRAVDPPGGDLPPVYRCLGTDDFAETIQGCGRLFRGRDRVHYRRENWPALDGADGITGEVRVYHRGSRRQDAALVVLLLVVIVVALGTR